MSLSRSIARHLTTTKLVRKPKKPELDAATLAIQAGVDVYHARIALRGTTISPAFKLPPLGKAKTLAAIARAEAEAASQGVV
jgi:hypothetical protein